MIAPLQLLERGGSVTFAAQAGAGQGSQPGSVCLDRAAAGADSACHSRPLELGWPLADSS